MAFTLAHMAAALPFYGLKRWLCFDALLIGTMMPDLPYYVGSSSSVADQSHEWLGVLTYNLPVGLLVFSVWYWGFKPATMALIQPFIESSITDEARLSYIDTSYSHQKKYRYKHRLNGSYSTLNTLNGNVVIKFIAFLLPVVFALILGAITHIIWDGITHSDGLIAKDIEWLQYPIYAYPFKGTSIARLLQYISSAAGLVALFGFVLLSIKHQHSNRSIHHRLNARSPSIDTGKYFFTKKQSLGVVGLIIILSSLWIAQVLLKNYWILSISPYTFSARVLVSSLQGVALLLIGYTIVFHIIKSTKVTS